MLCYKPSSIALGQWSHFLNLSPRSHQRQLMNCLIRRAKKYAMLEEDLQAATSPILVSMPVAKTKRIQRINVKAWRALHRAKSHARVMKAKYHPGDEPCSIWPKDIYFQLWLACPASGGPSLLGVTWHSRTKPDIANTIKSISTLLMSVDTSTIWWKTW